MSRGWLTLDTDMLLGPYRHELNGSGDDCALDCPACRWAVPPSILRWPGSLHLSDALLEDTVRSSSGPRILFTRPLPLSRRLGRSATGTPDFCIARASLPTAGFSVIGARRFGEAIRGLASLPVSTGMSLPRSETRCNGECIGIVEDGKAVPTNRIAADLKRSREVTLANLERLEAAG
jgi:hypothetical protein